MKSIYTSLIVFFILFWQAILVSKEEFLVGMLFVLVVGSISHFFGNVLQETIFQVAELWKVRFYKRFVFFHTVNQLLVLWTRIFFIMLQLIKTIIHLKNLQCETIEKNAIDFVSYNKKHIIMPIFENNLVVFYNMEKVLLLSCLDWVLHVEKKLIIYINI